MSFNWFRHDHGLTTNAKLQFVAKRCRRPRCEVVAVWCAMLENASANTDERGVMRNWNHEIVACSLDMEPDHVEAIHLAMQGVTLLGATVIGWRGHQAKREDDSADRVRAHRERKRAVTQCNAEKRTETPHYTTQQDTREELPPLPPTSPTGSEGEELPSAGEGGRGEEERAATAVSILDGPLVVGKRGGEPSVEARREVCRKLAIADADPIVAIYMTLDASRNARDPDRLFPSLAPKLFANAPDEIKARCRGPTYIEPPPKPLAVARPSAALAAKLNRGTAHA